MCGIVGYLGSGSAVPVLVSELRSLEYRGYDSAGLAVIEDGHLRILKAAGKLSNLEHILKGQAPMATVGIGHTRWATHGEPNDLNAHPHTDEAKVVAVVHNGIIENYKELKDELLRKDYKFDSDTDTEVVAHLVSFYYKQNKDMLEAIRKAVVRLKGIYALAILSSDYPDRIFAVNHHYSLTVGVGENESFLASDGLAVRPYTNQLLRLEQSEIVELSSSGYKLYSFEGKEIQRAPITSEGSLYVIDKGGYKHFLLKEINEQPTVLRQTLAKYLPDTHKPVNLKKENKGLVNGLHTAGIALTKEQIANIDRIQIVACGTALYSGMIGKYVLESLAQIPTDVEIASEIRGRKLLVNERTLTIAVSQSGETADTLAAIKDAKVGGSYTLGITNRPDSHLAHITTDLITTECGIEVSVAATKTYIAQLASFYLLGIYLAEEKGLLSEEKASELKHQLHLIPTWQEKILSNSEDIRQAALKYSSAKDVVFMGRGFNYPTALEGALKLKELTYIHASGYAAGELKHGPIAVLDEKVPVVTILVPGVVYDKTLSNALEAKARQAKMIAVAVEGDKNVDGVFDTIMRIPPIDEFLSPLLTVIPLQLFAYFMAEALGKDVDQPRNLAKSVTVE
jgi:glutamine---fructose-6-phosphate transaminase (isomerizing)